MRRKKEPRGILCGAFLGAAILFLFYSLLGTLGCLILAALICPFRAVRRKLRYYFPNRDMRLLLGLIAVLLCVVGVVLHITKDREANAEPEQSPPRLEISDRIVIPTAAPTEAPTEAPTLTPAPTPAPTPFPEDLPVYPAHDAYLYPDGAEWLTAETFQTAEDFENNIGKVYIVKGTLLFTYTDSETFNVQYMAISTDFGALTVVNLRKLYGYNGTDYDTPIWLTDGIFILTCSGLVETDSIEEVAFLYGAEEGLANYFEDPEGQLQLSPTMEEAQQDDYSQGYNDDYDDNAYEAEETEEPEDEATRLTNYVVNTSTGKFHKPSCTYAKKIDDANKAEWPSTYDAMITMGYSPCGHCNPR